MLIKGLIRTFRRHIWVHYKVVIFFVGVVIGILDQKFHSFRSFIDGDFVTKFSMNSVQSVFVPTLVFYDTFSMDSRAFLSTAQVAIAVSCVQYGN